MLRFNRLFTMLLLVALILSACQPITRPAAPEPQPPHGLRPDAPPYALAGPYAVGVRDFEIPAAKENERTLTASIWYPAVKPQGATESITYEMGFPAGETPNISVYGWAIQDAEPATDGAPYPLVVYTHAHWSFRQETAYLIEHLASKGFVVISADHEDNWSTLFAPKPWQSEFRRPNEVSRQIEFVAALPADDLLKDMIDIDHVAVLGWSFGGTTALKAGGARIDLADFRVWCEDNTINGQPPHTECVEILEHEAELARLAELDSVPQGLWPNWGDARVDAVVALAPWVRLLGAEGLQSVDVPTLLMIGSGDSDVGPAYRELQPYQQIAAEQRSEVVLENAEHLVFFSACHDAPEVVELGFHVFCSDPVWDMDRAHDLTNHFVTAFLLAELKGDKEAAKALAPENVAFPGIKYETTGYGK